MAHFAKHIFICTNERGPEDPRGCCKAKGSEAVVSAFRAKLHARGLKRVVRANKAGCLDQCANGVTVVVYPDGVWYGHVTVEDVEEIVESHIVGGRPVQRLVLSPDELTGVEPREGQIRG
jgi:(2Fe-2S) ferredoxin